MAVEMVLTKDAKVRFKDVDSGKWTKTPENLTINRESIRKNVGSFEPSISAVGESRKGLFDKKVTLKDIRQLFARDELLFASVNRLARDVFGKWCKITAYKENGEINKLATRKAEQIMKRIQFKQCLRHTFRSRMVNGVGVLALGFPGNVEQPVLDRNIGYVVNIPFNNLRELQVDLRPESETYGEVYGVKVQAAIGTAEGKQTATREYVLHYDRFQHWSFPDLDNLNPWGMSQLMPVHDVISVKKNIDWSLGETLYQWATGKFVALLPGNTPDDQFDEFEGDFKDFSTSTSFVARGEDFEIIEFGARRNALDPGPYTRYFMALASIGLGVPYAILFRGLTGGVSDILQRTYASDVGDIQREEVEPVVLDFLGRLRLGNVAEWKLDWKPIMELTEEEQSFIKSRLSLGRQLTGRAVEYFVGNGASVEFDEDGWIKRVFVMDGEEETMILHPPEPKEEPKPEPQPPQPGEPPQEPEELEMQQELMRLRQKEKEVK